MIVGEAGASSDVAGGFDAEGEAAGGSGEAAGGAGGSASMGGLGGGFWGLVVELFFCPPFFLAISSGLASYVDEYVCYLRGYTA